MPKLSEARKTILQHPSQWKESCLLRWKLVREIPAVTWIQRTTYSSGENYANISLTRHALSRQMRFDLLTAANCRERLESYHSTKYTFHHTHTHTHNIYIYIYIYIYKYIYIYIYVYIKKYNILLIKKNKMLYQTLISSEKF